MSHDILSDVLRSVHLRGAMFYYVSGSHDWVAEALPSRDIAAAVMPDSEHVMEYHVITHGSCWGAILGEPPVRLESGDVVLFPHGDAHVISSAGPHLQSSRRQTLGRIRRIPSPRLRLPHAAVPGGAAAHLRLRAARLHDGEP